MVHAPWNAGPDRKLIVVWLKSEWLFARDIENGGLSKVFCEYERSKLVLPTPPSPTAAHLMTLSLFAMPSTCGDTLKLCSVDPISSI